MSMGYLGAVWQSFPGLLSPFGVMVSIFLVHGLSNDVLHVACVTMAH
jgi:hypothetical protein